MKRFVKIFILSSIIFTLFFSGIIYFILKDYRESQFAYLPTNNNDIENSNNRDNNNGDDIYILLLGIDAKDIKNKDTHPRSDTIMLVRYDNITNETSILSIPRDTKAIIRGREKAEKINHAHAYGGPELTIKAVKDLLGVEADYFVEVDYNVVEEFVDIIGGVEVNVPMNMVYDDPYADPPLHINLKKGKQVLNGDKAIQFLRFRKGYSNQDIGRINAQQQFIKASIKKTLNPINILKLPKMINTIYKHIDTNVPLDVAMSYMVKAKDIKINDINIATLPGDSKMVNGIWYFIPDEEKTKNLITKMFQNHIVAKND